MDDTRDSYLCFYCGPNTKVQGRVEGRAWHMLGARNVKCPAPASSPSCCALHSRFPCTLLFVCNRLAAALPAAAQFDTNPFAEDDEQRAMEIQASAAQLPRGRLAGRNICMAPYAEQ